MTNGQAVAVVRVRFERDSRSVSALLLGNQVERLKWSAAVVPGATWRCVTEGEVLGGQVWPDALKLLEAVAVELRDDG